MVSQGCSGIMLIVVCVAVLSVNGDESLPTINANNVDPNPILPTSQPRPTGSNTADDIPKPTELATQTLTITQGPSTNDTVIMSKADQCGALCLSKNYVNGDFFHVRLNICRCYLDGGMDYVELKLESQSLPIDDAAEEQKLPQDSTTAVTADLAITQNSKGTSDAPLSEADQCSALCLSKNYGNNGDFFHARLSICRCYLPDKFTYHEFKLE